MSISIDELLKKTKDVVTTAGKVAGDVVVEVVDTSKNKLAEAKTCAAIKEINERLGGVVYSSAKTGRESIKLQEMLIAELDSLHKTLEQIRGGNSATPKTEEPATTEECNPHTTMVATATAAEELVAKADAMTEAVEDIAETIAEELDGLKEEIEEELD